jgi:hypothetical protein
MFAHMLHFVFADSQNGFILYCHKTVHHLLHKTPIGLLNIEDTLWPKFFLFMIHGRLIHLTL